MAPTFMAGPFWFLSLVAITLLPAPADAHLGHVVLRAERYIKFDVEPAALRIVVSLTLGPTEMERIMRDADGDGDGQIVPDEADRYMETWGEGLAEELTLRIDGEPVQVAWGDAYFDPQGPIRPVAGSVEMVARIELDPGSHRAEVTDEMPTEALDRTDIVIRTQPGGSVSACSSGGEAHPCEAPIALAPATAAQPIALGIEVAGLRTWQIALGAGAALFALLAGVILFRRRGTE